MKRASTDKLREIFNRYSSKVENGERFMTSDDFVKGFLGIYKEQSFNQVNISFYLIFFPGVFLNNLEMTFSVCLRHTRCNARNVITRAKEE